MNSLKLTASQREAMTRKRILQFPEGTRIRLIRMDDLQAPPVGTEGTVIGIDGIGSLLVRWDNGSRLHALLEDEVERI